MIQSLGRYTFRYKCKFMEFNIKDKAHDKFALRYYATRSSITPHSIESYTITSRRYTGRAKATKGDHISVSCLGQ